MGNGGSGGGTVPAVNFSIQVRGGSRLPYYSMDAFHVFYRGKVTAADANTFEDLGDGYGKDAFHVFFDGAVVPETTGMGFEVSGGGYAKDAFRSFFRGRPV